MEIDIKGLEELHGVVKPTPSKVREEVCNKLNKYNPGKEFTYQDREIYVNGNEYVGMVTTRRISRNQYKMGKWIPQPRNKVT